MADEKSKKDPGRERIVGGLGQITLSLTFVLAAAVLIYVLVCLWPDSGALAPGTGKGQFKGALFAAAFTLSAEQQLVVLVALTGVLGGLIQSLVALSANLKGEGELSRGQALSYFVTPVAGAVIALVFYVVIRAGFVNLSSTNDLNIYGYLAVALLSGLFAANALAKLEQIASAVLTSETKAKPVGKTAKGTTTEIAPPPPPPPPPPKT